MSSVNFEFNHGLEVLLKDETLWMKICNEIWTIIVFLVMVMTILKIKSIYYNTVIVQLVTVM